MASQSRDLRIHRRSLGVFLDEVGDLRPESQAALLRVLQDVQRWRKSTEMIDKPFDVLEGLEIWGAKIGVGTFFTAEFGPVEIVDGVEHGQCHLWISHAAWRLSWGSGWAGSGDSKATMQLAVASLNGSKLSAARCLEFGDLVLEFSGGIVLTTLSDMAYDNACPWDLFAPEVIYSGVARSGEKWTSEVRS